MRRHKIEPRANWKQEVERWGLLFHTEEEGVYWDESAFYEFTAEEINRIERATNELHQMCLQAAQHVIDRQQYARFGIPDYAVPMIEWAWEAEPPTLYGRFDLAFDGTEIKMLEYNADTPTSLLEAAVVQWQWLEQRFPDSDQFNSLYEALVAAWKRLKDERVLKGTAIHFASAETVEDEMTIALLRDTAHEAGLQTEGMLVEDIGWHPQKRFFVDLQDARMWTIFKLYPWEWMLQEEFGQCAVETYRDTQWIEPIWKLLLSNKALLAVMWEMFPGHPYLLPAYQDGPREMSKYVKKALLGREGSNVQIFDGSEIESVDGPYGSEGYIYQGIAPLPLLDGNRPVIGSWIIDEVAHGIGIRETTGWITNNTSRFVPHLFN